MAKFCIDCGYPLNDIDSRRCPECGRPFSPYQKRTYDVIRSGRVVEAGTRWPWFQIAILGLIPLYILRFFLGWDMYFGIDNWSGIWGDTSNAEGIALAFSVATQQSPVLFLTVTLWFAAATGCWFFPSTRTFGRRAYKRNWEVVVNVKHPGETKRSGRTLWICWLIMVLLAASSLWFATRYGAKHAEVAILENATQQLVGKSERQIVIRLPAFGPNIRVGMRDYPYSEIQNVFQEMREPLKNHPDIVVSILVGPGAPDAVVEQLVQLILAEGAVHVVVNREPIAG